EVESVDDFKKIYINSRGGGPNFTPIRLGQVATVEEGLADIRRLSRTNGKPSVGLGIRKQRGSNAVAVAMAVKAKMAYVQGTLPEGTRLNLRFDTTKFIQESVSELNFTLVISALLTAFVCWMFVGSWTSTLNILLAIPTSIVGTFIVLYFSGFTLNTFTLLGLSLAIGIVVDDAIMVLENVIRHREMGKDRVQAALDGSNEITFAAMAATISVCAIFLPVAFMTGVIGKYFYQFGVTMTAAVLLSLLEALTLTPMRCAQFVEAVQGERRTAFGRSIERSFVWTRAFYGRTLTKALDHPWKVVGSSLALFAGSLLLVRFLNQELLPAEDQGRFMVRMQTPVGSSLEFTDKKMKEVEDYLLTKTDVEGNFLSIGGFGGGEVNTAMAFLTLKPRGERDLSQHEIMDRTRKELKEIKEVKSSIQDLSMRGFTSGRGFAVEFTVRGPDWNKLSEYSEKIMAEMEKTGLMSDIDSNYEVGMPEIQVIPDREKASARGVSVAAIGQTMNATVGGVLVGRYPSGGHRYDIRLKLNETGVDRRERIKNLFVRNNRGELIALNELVRVEERPTLQVISRKDRQRAVSVYANVAKGKSQEQALQKSEEIARSILPAGYRAVMSGSSQAFKESQDNLIFALLLGIIVAYMVLASQFNSFRDPVSVLLALPFSVTGALLALLITRQSLNLYSMIGIILLMGIVKKNSILLVEFTNQLRERGEGSIRKALLEACPIRLRPILMTSIATIAGAIPLALGIGPGAESRIPMAIAVIGGVLVSTVLTLYVVPCFYLKVASKKAHQAH
ncbi:MAG: efflux RND transporter permease subunit, partial [Bdellovibrionia bacterium]